MTFLENEELLDSLNVQYTQEGFPESIDDSYDDSYDDSLVDSYDDSAEFNPISLMGNTISKGIGAVGNLLNRGRNTSVNLAGVRPGGVNTNGIDNLSQLIGSVTNAAGRQFQIRVPGAATAENVNKIKQALDAQNANIKKLSDTINKNATETAKIASEVNRVDSKHTAASKAQNKVLERLNGQSNKVGKRINGMGRHIERLEKSVKDAQSQTQMMAMMPMLMSNEPQLESINFETAPSAGTSTKVTSAKFSDKDNSALMMMMMMGGFGGSGGSGMGGDMMPMVMMMMMMK